MIEIIPNWHPVFVHFTVGLLSIAIILSIAVQFMSAGKLREQLQWVWLWNLWLGAGITVLTVIAGVVAYNSVAHDTPSHEAMTLHRNWALATAILFIVLAIWSWQRVKTGQSINAMLLVALLISGGLLASTAWLGGEAVYRYGLGVMSLPKTDNHEHSAEGHGDAIDHHDEKKGTSLNGENGHHDKPVHDNSDGHHDKKKVDAHHDDGHVH